MQKLISSGKTAMDSILEGVNLVANPVKSTISPNGKTVILSESFVQDYNIHSLPVTISKDGYRITKSISSSNPEVQVGVRLIQEAAEKQMIDAGDGTSTVCLLTQAILEGGLKLINEGVSSIEVVKGINEAVVYVVGELKNMATPVDGDLEKIRNVATVCSNNDEFIGGLIAEAFSKIGAQGIINIEESKGRETSIKISDGIKFNRGWASPYFVNNKAKAECELDNPYILIYDRPITQIAAIMPVLGQVIPSKRPLVIFCDDCDSEALATLTYNMQQGNMKSCAVNMAFLGDSKRQFLEDIAAATGGYFINELKGTKLENVKIEQLGQAQKVVVGKDDTVIIGGLKDENAFKNLIDDLAVLESKEEEGQEKDLLQRRIARLKGSVAILLVGATTELEMKEKKDRIDDAVRATRSAVEMGWVSGSGTAFLNVPRKKGSEGWELIMNVLDCSFNQICINSGKDALKVRSRIISFFEPSYGYNAKTDCVQDLKLAGIIEPVKSNICALQNAASVVTQILSSDYMVTDTM